MSDEIVTGVKRGMGCTVGVLIALGIISALVVVLLIGSSVFFRVFTDPAQENRDALYVHLQEFGKRAQTYYSTEGKKSFAGIDDMTMLVRTELSSWTTRDGLFRVSSKGTRKRLELQAVGHEKGRDWTNPVKLTLIVLPDTAYIDSTRFN